MKISDNVKNLIVVLCTMIGIGIICYFFGPVLIRILLYLFSLLSPFVFGYLFAKLINPIADKLQHKLKIPRGVSTALVIVLTIAALAALIGVVGYRLFDEIKNLYSQWPEISASVSNAWQSFSAKWSNLYIDMPDSIQSALDSARFNVYSQISQIMANAQFVDGAQNFAKALPGGLIWAVIFILSMFFMVSQKDFLSQKLNKYFSRGINDHISEIKRECKKYLGGYVKAQLILMLIVMLIIAVMLALFRAPFSLLIAAVTAILDALPIFGSGAVLWPLSAIYFISGNIRLGVGYLIVYLAVTIARRIFEPKLVSDKMGFNPIITLFSMYAGYRWWGIIGMITGPILLIAIMSIYRVGIFDQVIRIFRQLFGFLFKELKLFINYLDRITK